MLRTMIMAALMTAPACASNNAAANAYAFGQAAKQIAEPLGNAWASYVEAQSAKCLHELPPAEHTKAEFDSCLGPALQHETMVLPATEVYHAASLGLYVALTVTQTSESITSARADLAAALKELVCTVPSVNAEIERIRKVACR